MFKASELWLLHSASVKEIALSKVAGLTMLSQTGVLKVIFWLHMA